MFQKTLPPTELQCSGTVTTLESIYFSRSRHSCLLISRVPGLLCGTANDRQTQGHSIFHASIASHGKEWSFPDLMVYYESITDSDVENHRDVRQQDAKRKHDGGQDLPSIPSDNL